MEKEVSELFLLRVQLPVSYRRRLNLCTALSSSQHGHPGVPAATCICVVRLLPIERSVVVVVFCCFLNFGPPKINSNNSFFQFHGTISLEFSAGHSKKCTKFSSIQIAAKNLLVCPGLPVEAEEICVCVWQLNVDRERGKGEGE